MDTNNRKIIRKKILIQRSQLTTQQQHHANHRIAKHVLKLFAFLRSQRIAFYLTNKKEVSTFFLLKMALAYGKTCYLPILHPIKLNHLLFSSYKPDDPLKKNHFGIQEPFFQSENIVPPWSLDLIVTPLVAFDSQGHRLGMGGGYYDRTFSFLKDKIHHKPKLLGLAYDFQQVEQLPYEEWDIRLDYAVTESLLFNFTRSQL